MSSAAVVSGALRVNVPEMKRVKFANNVDPDETDLDPHFLPSIH